MMAVSVFSVVYPPLSCRTSPPQGGRVGTRQRAALGKHANCESTRVSAHMFFRTRTAERQPHPLSPLVGEMPGRAEGGELAPTSGKIAFNSWATPC